MATPRRPWSPRSVILSPAPANESPGDKAKRQQRDLLKALNNLHEDVVRWDDDGTPELRRVFMHPVDPTVAPDYYTVVQDPKDLTMIGNKIIAGTYSQVWEYLDDMGTMIENAMLYNKAGTPYNRYAQRLQKYWMPLAEQMVTITLESHEYCCGRRRQLSGMSYRCRGATCFIRYGCVYWSYEPEDGDDSIIYCQSHYQKLPAEVVIPRFGNGTGGDIKFPKSFLTRAKHNTPLIAERLVTCVDCGHQNHEICKLHNSYSDKGFRCNTCLKRLEMAQPKAPHSPRDLPECALSRALEKEVSLKVPLVGSRVCIRVVNMEATTCEMKPLLKERYPEHPGEFPYVQKYILAFLDVQVRPVCFFSIIVHECGSESPEPNRNRVYISLLDSIKLPKSILPSRFRTMIYHTVTRGYLRYVGLRGFKYGHIYTCPPRKGQNYIFPFKPDDQKEINTQRLRKWYADLLTEGAESSPQSIKGFENIGDAYKKPTLLDIPYFEGDNWPDIMEDILKLDNRQQAEEDLVEEVKEKVKVDHLKVWEAQEGKRAQHVKPKVVYSAGIPHYEFHPPPKHRKRRKSDSNARVPKQKYTLEERLNMVIQTLKRDFLVVELCHSGQESGRDPDLDLKLAKMYGDHTVASFFRAEKLEFSTLRHSKYSTMMLLHVMLLKDGEEYRERFPEDEKQSTALENQGGGGGEGEGEGGGGGGGGAVGLTTSGSVGAATAAVTTAASASDADAAAPTASTADAADVADADSRSPEGKMKEEGSELSAADPGSTAAAGGAQEEPSWVDAGGGKGASAEAAPESSTTAEDTAVADGNAIEAAEKEDAAAAAAVDEDIPMTDAGNDGD